MKKLIISSCIFCVFTATIWLLFSLIAAPGEKWDTATLLSGSVDRLSSDITSRWAACSEWDGELYQQQLTKIAQSYSAGLIDPTARKTLTDRVNKEGFHKAVEAMNREFARTNCNRATISRNYDGLMTVVSREPDLAMLPEVSEAMAVHALYEAILAFNGSRLGLSPKFDIASGQWSPDFNGYAGRVRAKRDALLASPYYSRLSHITDVSAIHSTDRKLADAKGRYYDALANAIASAYRSASVPDGDNADLRSSLLRVRSAAYSDAPSSFNAALSNLYSEL